MINSITYKLTKQPNTISEEIFEPNKNLIEFIENGEFQDSRIIVIQASNSSGKSFLLNSIAYAFNALELSNDNLSPTLRRSINYLMDNDHQKIDFNISINDPDGYSIESSYSNLNKKEISIKSTDGSNTILDNASFIEKYKLLYDIPEKPLDRIYRLLKSIKEFNDTILNQLNPLDLKLLNILRSVKDERDEGVIENIKNRINTNKFSVKSHETILINSKGNLTDLENNQNLKKLKRTLISIESNTKEYEKISLDFMRLTPPSNEKIEIKNNSTIIKLKGEIRDLRIPNLLKVCKEDVEGNEYSKHLFAKFGNADKQIYKYLFDSPEAIVNELYSYDLESINEILRSLIAFKNYSLDTFFGGIKSDLNELDFKLIKNMKSDFKKYEDYIENNEIINALFNKNLNEILNELNDLELKYSEITKINDIENSINDTIDKIKSRIEKGLIISKRLFREQHKLKKVPNQKNVYQKALDKKNNLKFSLNKESRERDSLRSLLEKNGIPLSTLNNIEIINSTIDNLSFKNNYCKGKEKEQINKYKSEISKFEGLITQTKITISNEEVKFKVENSKQSSPYAEHQRKIQIFSNKVSYFTKYLVQKNALINENGELNSDNSKKDISYMKIIGEFVASLMGNKIIYQDKSIDISYIDYSSKTPCFVSSKNKRIAFSDFSGGQGSSNYLKAKLNLNEDRKYIVLLDEIANMDNKSLNAVINRLKELDEKNKLLLAILVEPKKDMNIFKIKAY